MSTAVWPLQEGVHDALVGDATYNTRIGGRAYDEESRPDRVTLPFHSYGASVEGGWNAFNKRGNDGTLLIHLYAGDKETIAAMYGDINRLLDHERITIASNTVAVMTTRFAMAPADPSGAVHAIVTVSAFTQAA